MLLAQNSKVLHSFFGMVNYYENFNFTLGLASKCNTYLMTFTMEIIECSMHAHCTHSKIFLRLLYIDL